MTAGSYYIYAIGASTCFNIFTGNQVRPKTPGTQGQAGTPHNAVKSQHPVSTDQGKTIIYTRLAYHLPLSCGRTLLREAWDDGGEVHPLQAHELLQVGVTQDIGRHARRRHHLGGHGRGQSEELAAADQVEQGRLELAGLLLPWQLQQTAQLRAQAVALVARLQRTQDSRREGESGKERGGEGHVDCGPLGVLNTMIERPSIQRRGAKKPLASWGPLTSNRCCSAILTWHSFSPGWLVSNPSTSWSNVKAWSGRFHWLITGERAGGQRIHFRDSVSPEQRFAFE